MRNRMWYAFPSVISGVALLPLPTLAHCPLCTVGIGLVAFGAYGIGAKAIAIGVALGATAMAMGLWLGSYVPTKFSAWWRAFMAIAIWLLTLIPLRFLFADYASWYVDWGGEYGSLLNRTYMVNTYWAGAVIGTLLVLVAPALSRALTRMRDGQQIPFQGVVISVACVVLISVAVQLL